MVNVLFVDRNLHYYFTPTSLFLKDYAEEHGIPIDVRGIKTTRDAEQYIQWAQVAFVDGDMGGRLSWNDSGYAFIQELKKENPTARAVLFTGATRNFIPKECPFDDLILKPADIEERATEIIESYHRSVNK